MTRHALVLNASFEPLNIVSWQRAMQLLFQGKVEVVEVSDIEIRTVRISMKVPAVLRLLKYIPRKPEIKAVRFSRSNVFTRDSYQCQYCYEIPNRAHLTLDHVIPIVQGGKKDWTNIVTSCKVCNQKKGGRTPEQAGMALMRNPKTPNWLPMTNTEVNWDFTPSVWKNYLRR